MLFKSSEKYLIQWLIKLPQGIIDKLQILKVISKLKLYLNNSNYYKEMNYRRRSKFFQVEQDQFAEKD